MSYTANDIETLSFRDAVREYGFPMEGGKLKIAI